MREQDKGQKSIKTFLNMYLTNILFAISEKMNPNRNHGKNDRNGPVSRKTKGKFSSSSSIVFYLLQSKQVKVCCISFLFTIGEAAWSTCGNSHDEEKEKERFPLSLHKPSDDHILGFPDLGFRDFEIPGF